jgi:hypothetical protein
LLGWFNSKHFNYEKERRMAELGWLYLVYIRNIGFGVELRRPALFFFDLVGCTRARLWIFCPNLDGGFGVSTGLYIQNKF